MPTLYSVGHSNRSIEEFIELLQAHGITDLVDVRSRPYSRYNPQFNREPFQAKLGEAGIKYHFRGRNLGGLDGNTNFNGTITKLLEAIVNKPENRYAVCCSESKPEQCHRSDTILKEVEKQGGQMEHILWSGKTERAKIEHERVQPSLI